MNLVDGLRIFAQVERRAGRKNYADLLDDAATELEILREFSEELAENEGWTEDDVIDVVPPATEEAAGS